MSHQSIYDPYYDYLPHHSHTLNRHHHLQQHLDPYLYTEDLIHQPLSHSHNIPTYKYNNDPSPFPPPTANSTLSPHITVPPELSHIKTLFVSGLPDDVKPREIHNLFRRRPGFDSCQLKFTGRGNQVVAFVTFFSHQSAVMALQALDGVKFDPQAGSVLHLELARSNSRRKRKPGSGPYVVIDERKKTGSDADGTSSGDDDNEVENLSQREDSSLANSDLTAKSNEKKMDLRRASIGNERKENTSEGDLRPCSTLFIANLGPKCSEDELKQALSQHPGFNGLKLRTRGGMPVAFVDYEEVEQATNVMEALQGSMLSSSDRGGMHIEYARSKMRKP